MNRTLLIEPREPLIFRDAKPAGAGLSMRTVDWPVPSAVIGAIRSQLGRSTEFDPKTVHDLLQVEHIGPFLATEPRTSSGVWDLAFPAPADALLFQKEDCVDIAALRPAHMADGAGTNLPSGLVPLRGARPEKPFSGPAFWTAHNTLKWLEGSLKVAHPSELGPKRLPRETRVHVKINPETGAADEGMLFTTEGLEFHVSAGDQVAAPGGAAAICSQVRSQGEWPELEAVGPIGGERRLAFWSDSKLKLPNAPPALAGIRRLRLQLVTPAVFTSGWKPGWLGEQNSGIPPEWPDLKLRLVGAAVPRPIFHSGWDLTKKAKDAPKPTRLLVPAGSVYFFETDADVDARSLWLRSICDGEQDRRDGFGIVLCGGWEWL